MADTLRPLPAMLAQAPLNTAGLITPQVLRDVIVSAAIRGPADWLYRLGASPTVGRLTWNGAGLVQIHPTDSDGVDRSAALALLLVPGALLRLVDLASLAYLAAVVESAAFSGSWAVRVQALGVAGVWTVNDLVALALALPNVVQSPGPVYAAEVKGSVPVAAGQAVAVHASGTGVVPAIAAGLATAAVGLAQDSTAVGFACDVQTQGVLDLASWVAATGFVSLSPGQAYWLDPSAAGMLTATPPTAAGQVNQQLGVAVGPQLLRLNPSQPLLL